MNVPPPSSGGRDRALAHPRDQRSRLAGDLAQRLLVGVEHGRHDQRVVRRDGDAHVDARVQLDLPVAVAAVGARVLPQRQGRRLDDHVVVGRRRLASRAPPRLAGASRLSSARSATHPSMSTSICSEKSGIVAFDSAIRRAIVACVRLSSTTVVSPFAVATPSSTAAWLALPVARGAAPPSGRARRLCGRRAVAVAVGARAPRLARGSGPDAARGALHVRLHDPPAGPRARQRLEVDPALRASLRASGEALIRPRSASGAGASRRGPCRGAARPVRRRAGCRGCGRGRGARRAAAAGCAAGAGCAGAPPPAARSRTAPPLCSRRRPTRAITSPIGERGALGGHDLEHALLV